MGAAALVGFMVSGNGEDHVRDYQPRLASTKQAYSNHDARNQYYQYLLANSKTGKIEAQDRIDSWNAMQANNYGEVKSLSLSFVELGPDNIGGRTRGIGIDRSNDDIMYAGSVTGGLFKSTDRGNNWSRVDSWDTQVGALAISTIETTSDGTIYVGTGSDQFEGGITTGSSGAQAGANGVYYSTDGGANWTHLSGTSGSVMQVWRDPSQTDKIYIGGTSCLVSPNKSAGASALPSPVTGNGYDIKVSGDGSVVFVVARVGGTFRYYISTDFGSSFSQIMTGLPSSIGRAESAVTDVKNSSGFYNIYVSASTSSGGLHSVSISEDHGATWTNIGPGGSTLFNPYSTSLSNQGNYNQILSYVPGKPDQCLLGGIDQYHWEKSPGSSPTWGGWEQVSLWSAFPTSPTYIHADNHEMKWNSSGEYFYGNDGGVGGSFGVPPNSIFYPANKGYNVTQFYSIAHSKFGEVMAGSQDNGTLYNDFTLSSALQFREVMGGDGFDCDISHYDSDAMFGTVYNSSISRSEDGGANFQDISPPCSGIIGQTCGVFHTPIRLFEDPNDTDSQDFIEFYASDSTIPSGTEITYFSQTYNSSIPENVLTHTLTQDMYFEDSLVAVDTNASGEWYSLHPGTGDTIIMTDSLMLNVPLDTIYLQDPVQSMMATLADGIMLTRDALRFGKSPEWWDISSHTSYSGTPFCFEFSWDGNHLFVGTFGGVWRFSNLDSVYSASQVSTITATKIYNTSRVVNGIGIDKSNPDRIVVAVAGTGGNGVVELNGAITSGGAISGTNLQGSGIPTSMAVLDVIVDYRDPNKLIAATDFGVWASSDNGSNWTQCINETGPVPVFAIRQQQRDWKESPRAGEIYIGTHGRGVWSSGSVLSNGDVEHPDLSGSEFTTNLNVYPNPMDEAGQVSFTISEKVDAKLHVYSIHGKLVKTITKSALPAGKHIVDLDMSDVGKGTYVVQLVAGNSKDVTRFIKLR